MARYNGIGAIPFNQHGHRLYERDADGVPRCPKGWLFVPFRAGGRRQMGLMSQMGPMSQMGQMGLIGHLTLLAFMAVGRLP